MINTITNYEKTKISMANIFLQYDQKAMIKKFSLEHDPDWLSLTFVNRIYHRQKEIQSLPASLPVLPVSYAFTSRHHLRAFSTSRSRVCAALSSSGAICGNALVLPPFLSTWPNSNHLLCQIPICFTSLILRCILQKRLTIIN